MRALVTGCAGFIGSHVTDALLARGDEVLGIDAFTPYYGRARKETNLEIAVACSRFQLIEADLRNLELGPLLDGVDVVFHLAGQPGVRASWSDRFPTYVEHNILATQWLLESLRAHPVKRVVLASSSSVYGNAARYPTTEDDLPRPHSPYGITKLAAEQLCGAYAQNWAILTTSLRYFTVYGPRQRPDMGFARLLAAALSGRPLPVLGDGEQTRDFTYVDDVVAATIMAGTKDVEPGSIFNVAGGSEATVNSVVSIIADLIGSAVDVEQRPGQPGDVRRTGGSIDRARMELGWTPSVSLREGLAAQLAWSQQHP
jgi:nucleoside-diphosphate-sugar epimerase